MLTRIVTDGIRGEQHEEEIPYSLAIVLGFLASAQAQTDYVKAIEKWRSEEEAT